MDTQPNVMLGGWQNRVCARFLWSYQVRSLYMELPGQIPLFTPPLSLCSLSAGKIAMLPLLLDRSLSVFPNSSFVGRQDAFLGYAQFCTVLPIL